MAYSMVFDKFVRGNISYELGLVWQFKVGGITMGPEIGFRREGWQARTWEVTENPDNAVLSLTGPYENAHLRQINFGLSVFF